jgi:hypothetical protein
MSDEQPTTKCYVEQMKDGRWQTVAACTDDAKALRALLKARDADPKARLRITNEAAKVLLDVPVK